MHSGVQTSFSLISPPLTRALSDPCMVGCRSGQATVSMMDFIPSTEVLALMIVDPTSNPYLESLSGGGFRSGLPCLLQRCVHQNES